MFANGTKGLQLNTKTLALEIVSVGEGGVSESDVLVHDETNRIMAQMLVALPMGTFPMPLGVIYREPVTTSFDESFWQGHATQGKRTGKVADALRRGSVWTKD